LLSPPTFSARFFIITTTTIIMHTRYISLYASLRALLGAFDRLPSVCCYASCLLLLILSYIIGFPSLRMPRLLLSPLTPFCLFFAVTTWSRQLRATLYFTPLPGYQRPFHYWLFVVIITTHITFISPANCHATTLCLVNKNTLTPLLMSRWISACRRLRFCLIIHAWSPSLFHLPFFFNVTIVTASLIRFDVTFAIAIHRHYRRCRYMLMSDTTVVITVITSFLIYIVAITLRWCLHIARLNTAAIFNGHMLWPIITLFFVYVLIR